MRLAERVHQWRRRLFGRYTLDDPRPIQKAAPYTYFLPSDADLDSLRPDDLAKLIFRSHPPGPEWGAERMWVRITAVEGDVMRGVLDNVPSDMPQLKLGAKIGFRRHHVIDLRPADGRPAPLQGPQPREYWDRCLVDACVVEDGTPVGYLYREEPDMMEEGDKYPDSGWRIRGDYRALSDEEIDAREMRYIALGAVLNADDSWLSLIDEPIGARFHRDFENGGYLREEA